MFTNCRSTRCARAVGGQLRNNMTPGTIVFIFLIDDFVPGGLLNKTLQNILVTHTNTATINRCDSSITDPLLQTISKQLDAIVVPKWMIYENMVKSHLGYSRHQDELNLFNNTSYETLLNVEKDMESSLEFANSSFEMLVKDLEQVSESEKSSNETVSSSASAVYFGRLPFLTAIFESLENVTAQTCAGTLISSEWVLTAANCVQLLANMYNISSSHKSVYTVISNTTDPLTDGTVHNVTQIVTHPGPDDVPVKHLLKHLTIDDSKMNEHPEKDVPKIALMRISPPAVVRDVEITDQIERGRHVSVYGWVGHKDESGQEILRAVAFDARALLPLECSERYNITEDFSQLCLATGVENAELVQQMTWGGPVVSQWGVCGVARGDGNAPLSAWPLAQHRQFINNTIGNSSETTANLTVQ